MEFLCANVFVTTPTESDSSSAVKAKEQVFQVQQKQTHSPPNATCHWRCWEVERSCSSKGPNTWTLIINIICIVCVITRKQQNQTCRGDAAVCLVLTGPAQICSHRLLGPHLESQPYYPAGRNYQIDCASEKKLSDHSAHVKWVMSDLISSAQYLTAEVEKLLYMDPVMSSISIMI